MNARSGRAAHACAWSLAAAVCLLLSQQRCHLLPAGLAHDLDEARVRHQRRMACLSRGCTWYDGDLSGCAGAPKHAGDCHCPQSRAPATLRPEHLRQDPIRL